MFERARLPCLHTHTHHTHTHTHHPTRTRRWCVGDYCAIDETGAKLAPRKTKSKRTLGESFAVVRDSPKVLNLALLVVCYGVSHRLFEVSA